MAGLTFWLQEQLPGTVLERVPVPGWLIPEVLRLNDAQAGLGDGTRQLPGMIAATLTTGGDAYCVHATLQARPGASPRSLLAPDTPWHSRYRGGLQRVHRIHHVSGRDQGGHPRAAVGLDPDYHLRILSMLT